MKEYYYKMKMEEEKRLNVYKKKASTWSFWRLIGFGVAAVSLFLGMEGRTWMFVLCLLSFSFFIYGIYVFSRLQKKMCYSAAKYEVLARYEKRLDGTWKEFEEQGKEYLSTDWTGDETKTFAMKDLDIVGYGSLFQFLNVAVSTIGKEKLVRYLTCFLGQTPSGAYDPNGQILDKMKEEIVSRQEGIKELLEKESFSLHLESLLCQNKIRNQSQRSRQTGFIWENRVAGKGIRYGIGISLILCYIATLLTLFLGIFQVISFRYLGMMFAVQFLYSFLADFFLSDKSAETFQCLGQLSEYQVVLNALGTEEFHSEILKKMQNEIAGSKKGIDSIKKIAEAMQFRSNPLLYGLLGGICLYNILLYLLFQNWKEKYGSQVNKWFEVVGQLEVLLSLSVPGRLTKNYVFPQICCKDNHIKAIQMRHMLIDPERVVANDCDLDHNIRLITGSNMSGKTTYLRTLGTNMVLALSGTLVYAEQFQTGIMPIFTSMRVVDDVSRGISTFYAEVLRIKSMIEYSKKQLPMLVLIDEIFKGTNSADRILGASGVIKALLKPWITGMITTHDFELCNLAKDNTQLQNYHFDEYFEQEQLKFEYQIKEGQCKTTNAIYILKMAGIEVEQ